MRRRPQSPKSSAVREFHAWRSPATKARTSIAAAADCGIAEGTFRIRTGIRARPIKVQADSGVSRPPGTVGDCTAWYARILDGDARLR